MKKAVLFLVLCLWSIAADAGTLVSLRASTEIDRDSIRLADVFDGIPQDLDRNIAVAPYPGKSVTYDVRVLSKLAQDYRLDWTPQGLDDKSLITRASTKISSEMIQKAAQEKLVTQPELTGKNLEIFFDNPHVAIDLPAKNKPDFSFVNFAYDSKTRRFRANLVAMAGNVPVDYPVSGHVLVKKDIPVLAQTLAAGAIVGTTDISWISLDETKIVSDMIAQASDVVGMELRHDQRAGEVLRARDLMVPRFVKRGDLVTLKIETLLMNITTQGQALQDGGKGEVIRVTNTQSKRVVEGIVESSGVVRVGASPKLVHANAQE